MPKILTVIVLLVFVFPIFAREITSPVWNWGWDSQRQELLAYSENGDVNHLLNNVTEVIDNIWRISENRGIALIRSSDQVLLYSITDKTAQKLLSEISFPALAPFITRQNGIGLEAYYYPYMVLAPWQSIDKEGARPAFLVNLTTNTVGYLNDSVETGFCCRFTQDGHSLRYLTRVGGYGGSITLHERSLDTNSEKVLYTQTSGHAESDTNGDRWLFYQQENDISQYRIFDVPNGRDELIYKRDPNEYYTYYQFVGDDLISYKPPCEASCTLELRTADGKIFSYPLPYLHGGGSLYEFYRSSDNKLAIGRLTDYWLLSVANAPEFMGYDYSDSAHLSSTSGDSRFTVISDTELYPQTRRMIIDWKMPEILLTVTQDPDVLFEITYDNEGFLINPLDNHKALIYSYAKREALALPESLQGTFFDILPDGSILYRTSTDSTFQISRYFPQTNQIKILAEGLVNIPTIDAINYLHQ